MKKLILLPLLLVLAVLALPSIAPRAHAFSAGAVCIQAALPSTTQPTSCPSKAPTITVPSTIKSTFALEVDVFNSSALNGFDIAVQSDPAVAKPLTANLTGSIINNLPGSFGLLPLVNCVNNVGTNCVTTVDAVGVAHIGVASLGGLSNPPTTGRLMYINYNVTGTSTLSPVVYPASATQCASSSSPNFCVTISGTTGASVPETIVTAFITNKILDSTSTSVACGPPTTILPGGTTSCKATVSDTANAANTPTGSVTFTSSNTAVGTVGASCGLMSGSCSVTFTGVAVGTATVTGTYVPDTTHLTSMGTSNTITVAKDSTSTTVGPVSCNIALGATSCSTSVTATVTDTTTPANIPTGGTVTFTLTAGTTGGSLNTNTCILSSGSCSVTFTGTTAGSGSITASYGGDATHLASPTSAAATVTVTKTPNDSTSTSVSCAPASIAIGGTSTCTATVTDTTTPANTPTGSVTFTSSNTAVGTVGASCGLTSGKCTVTFTGVAAGTATVTGTYVPDGTHLTSMGTSNTITVVPPQTPPSVSAPTTESATVGTTLTFTVTASDADGDTITSLVATGLPSGATFTVTGTGTTTATGTFTWTPGSGTGGTSTTVMFTATDSASLTGSASTTINVAFAPVHFFAGKLSWTHHLSLAKNHNTQTWTAKIVNDNGVTVFAQITIVGTDGTGTIGFTTTSTVLTLTAGQSLTPTITQTFTSADIGIKFHFTATILWGTSPTALTNPGGNTKSGAFAVVA